MKKVMLTAIFAVITIVSVNAQISFGAKAGLNLASITGDDTSDLDSRTSFHFGAVVEIEISDKLSFQPELLYSAQGAKYSEESYEVTYKLDYLNLPLMAKYYVADNFSIEVGPQVGFKISSKIEAKFDGESESEDVDGISSIDFGANFGLGYKLDNGINFGARYNLGLSNVNDGEGDGTIKNGVFQFSVGYFFN